MSRALPEVTDAMVDAYLQANDAYWKRTDELPQKPDKWRNGTPREATRESLRAALASLQGLSPAQATARTPEALHAAIMNLQPFQEAGVSETYQRGYASGHWDARRAAAELVAASPSNGIAGDAAPQEQPHVSFVDGDSERAIEKWLSTIDPVAEADTEDQSHLAGGASQSVREQAVAWMLYEHDDGRHAVAPTPEAATFARGDPAWHRVGPVDVYASPLPAVQTDIGSSVRHLAALVTDVEKEKAAAVSAAYEDAARIVEKRLVIHPKRSAIAKEIRAAALHQAHQKEGAAP